MSLFLQVLFALMIALIAVHIVGYMIRVCSTMPIVQKFSSSIYASCGTSRKHKSMATNLAYFTVATTVFALSFQEAGRFATLIY